jgi:two-component system response regulator YesN
MNVLVVDDEPIVRMGLRSLVDWERHGLKFVGDAADGVEAWEMLMKEKVDILVTDILMPRMDGLELIRRLKELDSEVGVLVLSCLDDFAYVKEAMKLGAQDYILKPTMEPEQLIANILEVRKELERRRTESEQMKEWRRKLEETKQMQLALRVQSFLERGEADGKLEEDLFPRGCGLCSIMVYGQPATKLPLWEWNAGEEAIAVKWQENRLLLLFPAELGPSRHELHRQCYMRAQAVSRRLQELDGVAQDRFFIGMGGLMCGLRDVPAMLRLHERQIDHRFYHSGPQIVDEPPPGPAQEAPLPYDCRNDLLRALFHGNRDAVLHSAEQLGRRIAEHRPAVSKLFPFIYELMSLAASYAREQGFVRMDDYERRYLSMEAIQSCMSAEALCEWLMEALRALWEYRTGPVFDALPANPFIRKALQYMKENYNRNLSTADIALHVKLSRSYFSDLYSREMGEPPGETLTRIRMNEAKRMLREGRMKIYEIAEAVGFSDAKAFAKAFKKVVGCTPKEYEQENK